MATAVAFLLSASGAFVATSHAQTNPPVLPPDTNHYGKSYGEWSAAYWRWLFSLPLDQNPLRDGDLCLNGANGQTGPVWFLADNGGGVSVRNCSVPASKALFFMVLAGECSTLESPPFHGNNEAELRACIQGIADQITVVTCEVDGVSLQGLSAYRVQSPLIAFTLPDNNFLSVPAGTGLSVSDGYFVMLSPLPQGQHTIHVHSELPAFGFVLDITYHLTVEAAPVLAISSVGGSTALQISGAVDRQYVVEYATALAASNTWTALPAFTLTNSPQTFVDLTATNIPQRFYRAQRLP